MNIALWIVAGFLALAFLASGLLKLIRPKEKLAASGLAWAEDFTAGPVKLIGLAEVLGALGLILPAVFGVATILVPIAATALAVLMAGAVVVHLRRGEVLGILPSLILGLLALFVAIGRFGPWAF